MSWLRLMEESIKKNRVKGLIKEMWPAYLIEILVIILGISITLVLEEWRDSSRERRLEQIYLENLLTDVNVDLQSLNYTSAATQKILDRGNELLACIGNPDSKVLSLTQLNTDVRAILGRPNFLSTDATFSDLKSSGNLHLLEDIQLKNLLFAYYNQVQNIKDNQNAEQQATIILAGSYFLKQFSMNDVAGQPQPSGSNALNELPKNIEFSNNVLLRVTNRKELLDLYQKADSLAGQLKQALLLKTGAR
jgi:hypothetical protein